MGEPPYPAEPGMRCEVCWGAGGPWEGPPTPKYLGCSITGVERSDNIACQPLPADCGSISVVLEQSVGSPCVWEGNRESEIPGIFYFVSYTLGGVNSVLECKLNGLLSVFFHRIASICQTSFTNQNTPPKCYAGGGGSIS